MPNWCNNVLCATAPSNEAYSTLKNRVEEDGDHRVIDALHPPPADAENWTLAQNRAWGVRSGDLSASTFHDETLSIEIAFESAWAPPIHVLDYLRNQRWTNGSMLFVEPGVGFIGWYDMTMEDAVYLELSELFQVLRSQGEDVLRLTLEQHTQVPEYLEFLVETIGNEIEEEEETQELITV
jgi:hypothetical protein